MAIKDTITDLLSCIDAGDRDALYPLADLLTEEGDPLAEGVLWLIAEKKWPMSGWKADGYVDWFDDKVHHNIQAEAKLPRDIFKQKPLLCDHRQWTHHYESNSLALLAAATGYVASLTTSPS